MSEKQNPPNGLVSIFVDVILPVLILNKLTTPLGALSALGLALALPLGHGIFTFIKQRKTNYFSVLGVINVTFTGGLAVYKLDGMWFCAKEAIFPSLVGVFVFASSFTENPFIKTMLLNPNLVQLDLIHEKLEEHQQWHIFENHVKQATQFLAGTFIVSAVINFFIALRIFLPIDQTLNESDRASVLNTQIADMHIWSAIIILVPSMIMTSLIIYTLFKGISKATGLEIEKFMKDK